MSPKIKKKIYSRWVKKSERIESHLNEKFFEFKEYNQINVLFDYMKHLCKIYRIII